MLKECIIALVMLSAITFAFWLWSQPSLYDLHNSFDYRMQRQVKFMYKFMGLLALGMLVVVIWRTILVLTA